MRERLLSRARAAVRGWGGPRDAARALALHEGTASVEAIRAGLRDPSPGVRRAAARACGRLPPAPGTDARLVAALHAAWREETTCEGLLALALALRATGAAPADTDLREALVAREARGFVVAGDAAPARTGDAPPHHLHRPWAAYPRDLAGRFDRPVAAAAAVPGTPDAGPRAGEGAPPPTREDVLLRALRQDPADHAALARLARDPGRRAGHLGLQALGLHGDPRGAPLLREALRAMDVDPGRGFAQRRLAALGLGRLGLREAVPWLLEALAVESRDYEGRPGAGLGVQYPVRGEILLALGELGDARALPALVAHLSDPRHHLPAMGALHALGPLAHPALDAAIARGPEPVAARARAVRDPSRQAGS